MIIDGDKLIEQQLSLTTATITTFEDGSSTPLTPVRMVPPLAGAETQLSLNGEWSVSRWPFKQSIDALCAVDTNDSAWPRLAQPGIVFYGDPEENPATVKNWNRVSMTHIDPEDGAVIRRLVTLPTSWKGKRIYLRFNAIYPAGIVYCNGRKLGEQTSGLTPIEWDVTDLVAPGQQALVAVRLLRTHKFVKMDMPRHALEFTGLAQDAFFHATEPVQIADYHLISKVEDDLKSGCVSGSVKLRNHGRGPVSGQVRITLAEIGGTGAASACADIQLDAGAAADVDIAVGLAPVNLWNAEIPALYKVTLALDCAGCSQEISWRTGFRKFELRDERAWLNDRPVKFRGVNHLTYHPEHGMYTPKPWLRECLTLMKKANVNAIRTHFLGPPALAELCDELGIYLMQELPIDWGTNYIHDPEWVGPAMQRLEGSVRRDRHCCSIMVWSVGNENMPQDAKVADQGWNHMRIYDRFVKRLDPTRPTMFPPPGPANKIKGIFEVRVGDIADTHYSFNLAREIAETGKLTNPRSWEADMETVTREEAIERGWSGVWFSSEYGIMNMIPDLLHAPYASIITDTPEDPLSGKNTLEVFYQRLAHEWGYMRDDPTCLGGAYFPWLCSGTGNNPWGWTRWGEDADWGVVTADLLPKPAFWALRVLFSPVQFPRKAIWRPGDEEITFDLHNGYNAIDLKECTLRTMMSGGGRYMGMMREWRDVHVTCAPGHDVTVHVPIWNESSRKSLADGSAIACRCILLEPNGFRPITWDVIVMPEALSNELDEVLPVGPDAVL